GLYRPYDAAHPIARHGSHQKFAAHPGSLFCDGSPELGSGPRTRDHTRRRRTGHEVVLPRTGIAIAIRPSIDPVPVPAISMAVADIFLPCPGRIRPPGVGSRALFPVRDEITLIAVARGPHLDAFALLAPSLELAPVACNAGCLALALCQPVHASAG